MCKAMDELYQRGVDFGRVEGREVYLWHLSESLTPEQFLTIFSLFNAFLADLLKFAAKYKILANPMPYSWVAENAFHNTECTNKNG